jgi:SAM-dependent methyltransferase
MTGEGVWHRDVLARLLEQADSPTSYLEVGFGHGQTWNDVSRFADEATCVEPDQGAERFKAAPGSFHWKTSDAFFADKRQTKRRFDVVFIDGDHSYDQVKRDFENAVKHLKPGGTVALHDAISSGGIYGRDYGDSGDVHRLVDELGSDKRYSVEVMGPWPGLALVKPKGG